VLRTVAVGGKQLGERQTQQSLETPLLNDDNDNDDDVVVGDVTNSCTI